MPPPPPFAGGIAPLVRGLASLRALLRGRGGLLAPAPAFGMVAGAPGLAGHRKEPQPIRPWHLMGLAEVIAQRLPGLREPLEDAFEHLP